jgi:hypothetical protein
MKKMSKENIDIEVIESIQKSIKKYNEEEDKREREFRDMIKEAMAPKNVPKTFIIETTPQ